MCSITVGGGKISAVAQDRRMVVSPFLRLLSFVLNIILYVSKQTYNTTSHINVGFSVVSTPGKLVVLHVLEALCKFLKVFLVSNNSF